MIYVSSLPIFSLFLFSHKKLQLSFTHTLHTNFLLFFIQFYFIWLFFQSGFFFSSRSFRSQISFFTKILIIFWVRFQLICTLVLKPGPFLIRIYVCMARITHIVGGTKLVVINTRLLYIGVMSLFKYLFFKIRNRYKSYILELCKLSLGCYFSDINCLYRPDHRKSATIL